MSHLQRTVIKRRHAIHLKNFSLFYIPCGCRRAKIDYTTLSQPNFSLKFFRQLSMNAELADKCKNCISFYFLPVFFFLEKKLSKSNFFNKACFRFKSALCFIRLRIIGRRNFVVIYCEMFIDTTLRVTVLLNPGRQLISCIPMIGGITAFLTIN